MSDMSERKVRVVLVASGSGTDANSVMADPPPNGEIMALLSTVEGAGCLEKARAHGIECGTIARDGKAWEEFEREVTNWITSFKTEAVFLLGCIHLMPLIPGVLMWNIHPACPRKHGGRAMHGLEPHKHVLAEIVDEIKRGMAKATDRFFTHPTVHEANAKFDQGEWFLRGHIEVPRTCVELAMNGQLEEAAKGLQKEVLPYEWLMLPAAVRMACRKILGQQS